MNKLMKGLISLGAIISLWGVQPLQATYAQEGLRTQNQIEKDLRVDDQGNTYYTIKPGDTIDHLAAATKLPYYSYLQLRNMKDQVWIEGTVLKISPDGIKLSVLPKGDNEFTVGNQEKKIELKKDSSSIKIEVDAAKKVVKKEKEQQSVKQTTQKNEITEPAKEEVEIIQLTEKDIKKGYELTVEATAYSYLEAGLSNYTADGTNLKNNPNVIAVDPSVIPLGTWVEIPGYGRFRAADTGGAIRGKKIDVHLTNLNSVYQFGRRKLTIRVLQ